MLFYLNLLQSPISTKSYHHKSFPIVSSHPITTADNVHSSASCSWCRFPQWGRYLKGLRCGVFRKNPELWSPFAGPTQTAVTATVILMWLSPWSGVHNSQDANWQQSHPEFVIFTLLDIEKSWEVFIHLILQSNCCAGFSLWIVCINSIYHRLLILMLNRADGYSSHHCRCLFKEPISHRLFPILLHY
jgi:hypothetical protein